MNCKAVIEERLFALSGEVEVGVIGQIDRGGFVRGRFVFDAEAILIGKDIDDRHREIPG